MIVWLKMGESSYEVAERLFCPWSKVMYWKKRYVNMCTDGLKTEAKSGRPSLMPKNAEEETHAELLGRDHWKTSEISKFVNERSQIIYTKRYISRMA